MKQNQKEAQKLVTRLEAIEISAEVKGGGVHWKVIVTQKHDRSLAIPCFWYQRHISGLRLGMNPGNARSSLSPPRLAPYEGAEFEVIIEHLGQQVAIGRTCLIDEAIQCIRSWMSGNSLETVIKETPFINKRQREMKAIAAKINPSLRWKLGENPSYPLLIYGNGRSCRVYDNTCAFFLGQQQVAFTAQTANPHDIEAWLIENVSLASLSARNIELERHAQVLEIDPARWHWLHVKDRIKNPNDPLFPLAPLITELSKSHIVSQFYTYSSLQRLCFSASSHYPWAGKYPIVWGVDSDKYIVDDAKYSLDEAVVKIEAALALSPIQPFFGSASDLPLK